MAATPGYGQPFGSTSDASSSRRRGAFAGAQVQLTLGGRNNGRTNAGITLAPMQQDKNTGTTKMSKGLQLGWSGDKLGFSLAGEPMTLDQNTAAKKLGVSNAVIIGGGVLVAAGNALVIFADAMNRSSEGLAELV